jgi:hypothetical protein
MIGSDGSSGSGGRGGHFYFLSFQAVNKKCLGRYYWFSFFFFFENNLLRGDVCV